MFDAFARPIRKLLTERGFTEPTLPQSRAIPPILEGKNVLLISPAGTGKTEAAFLPVLQRLLASPREPGIKAIYVTPLRALNRDMLERLEWWCRELDLRISVRHGDTAQRERREQALVPPDVLITTPETLQILLIGRRLSQHLISVRWVIVDEVHELADNKRGSQLSLTLERLRRVKGGDFQLIGLSATIGSPREVARFLVGVDRHCEVIEVNVARELKFDVSYPRPTRRDQVLASDIYTYPSVAARLRVMRKLIEEHGSTLVFTNTRPTAEILASRFRLWDLRFPVSVHHGSLSSFSRVRVEQELKRGELKGIICVSGDSKILLADGAWKPIKEVSYTSHEIPVLSLLHSLKIRPAMVRQVKETGVCQLLNVSARSGFELKCTPDHRFLTIDENGKSDWVKAKNLVVGSPIALARRCPQTHALPTLFDFLPGDVYIRLSKSMRNKVREILKRKYGTYSNIAGSLSTSRDKARSYLSRGVALPYETFSLLLQKVGLSLNQVYPEIISVGSRNYPGRKLPLFFNEKIARFIGFLLAEGSITRRDMIRLFNTDLKLLQRYVEILKSEFGLRCTLFKQASGVWVARSHAAWLCDFFRCIGITSGRKATKISVPSLFFGAPANMVFAFLAGYFDGDGCLEKREKRICSALFYTSSKNMAKDLQLILLSQGILSSLRNVENKGRSMYVVAVFGGEHLRNFLKNCPIWRKYDEKEVIGKGYSHRDCIPRIGTLLKSIRKQAGLTTYSMQEKYRVNPLKYERNERAISRGELKKLISIYEKFTHVPEIFKSLSESDIFWDLISNVETTGFVEPVYDAFDVGGSSNFIANGFITHNCTSSMELGIDIGKIDLVIQYNSPRQVTRLLQRVGRSGHRIGEVANGVIVVQDPDDALESIVISARSRRHELEPVSISEKPFDVLLHALVSILAAGQRCTVDGAYELCRRAYPFRNLEREDVLKVLRFAHGLSKRLMWLSRDEREFSRPRPADRFFNYYFSNLSMIPEVRQYLVVDDERRQPVGILDESFVAEHGTPGVKFVMAGKPWRVLQVFKDKVYVKPDEDPLGAIPTWIGEEIPVPYSVAQEVGKVRARVSKLMREGKKSEEIVETLADSYGVARGAMELALEDTHKQVGAGLPLPTDRVVTVERVEKLCIVSACFGTLVNRTLARLLANKASEELGEMVATSVDPYRIILRSEELEPEQVIEILRGKLSADLKKDLYAIIEQSQFFRWRLAQVARRMGVLEREAELTSAVIDKLMRGLRGTPVYEETFKEVVHKDLDLERSLEVLERMRSGGIELVSLGEREEATPVSGLLWRQRYLALEPVMPERLRLLSIASAKARLLSEARTFVCTSCKEYVEELQIHELTEHPKCPRCGSSSLGMVEKSEEEVQRAIDLLKRGHKSRLWREALESAKLISRRGKLAAMALVARGVTPSAAREILEREQRLSSRFLELVLNKEREALFKRFKWK